MPRGRELLQAAATAFEDCQDPFSTDWLVSHHVTADECFTLSEHIAEAIYAWLAIPMKQKAALIAVRLAADRQEADE